MNIQEKAQKLYDYCYQNFCYTRYNSEGKIINRKDSVPTIRMIYISHISFLLSQDIAGTNKEYYAQLERAVDNCI